MRLEVDRLDKVGEAFRSRSGYIQSRVNKYGSDLTAQHHRKYEGGHIVGHQFGGPPEEINVVAMLEEVNQYRVGSDMESFKLLEDKVAANPGDFNKLVLEFKYPGPAGVELKGRDKVPASFEAKWFDASGVPESQGFRNTPDRKR